MVSGISSCWAYRQLESLAQTRVQLAEAGWTTEGSLGAGNSLLARDPDGMRAVFVEISGGTA